MILFFTKEATKSQWTFGRYFASAILDYVKSDVYLFVFNHFFNIYFQFIRSCRTRNTQIHDNEIYEVYIFSCYAYHPDYYAYIELCVFLPL